MQINVPGSCARNREREANHGTALECADDLPADFIRHNEHAQRHEFGIGKILDFFLQDDACPKLLNAAATAQFDLAGAQALFSPASRSRFLAFCHRASSSSIAASSAERPETCKRSSIH